MYLRFSGFDLDDRTRCSVGVFQIAYELLYLDVEDYLRAEMWLCLDWFDEHLAAPNRLYRPGRSRYAISWFRAGARRHIAMARRLVAAIEEAGVPVQMLRTERPGYVVYQDEEQVVAVPFQTC